MPAIPPLKITFYTDTPLYGGAEIQMLTLAKNLKATGFDISIICRNVELLQKLIKSFEQLNIPCYLLKSKSKNSAGLFIQLHKILKKINPDIVHSQLWNPMANKHLFLVKAWHNFKIVSTEHDPFSLGFLKSLYKRWSFRLTDQIICVSQANADLMGELYPRSASKITVIHNGIEPISPISPERRLTLRKKVFGISSLQTKIIFSAGTLHQRKGYKYLILALQSLSRAFSNCVLIIAGEGPERPVLEKLIKNLDLDQKVMLIGFQNNIPELIGAADIFVLPSLKEAFGLVVLESLAAKTPVIASAVGGIPEIITDCKNGLLVKPQNKDNLIKAIRKLLTDSKLCQHLIENGGTTLNKFSVEKMTTKTTAIYSKMLNKFKRYHSAECSK